MCIGVAKFIPLGKIIAITHIYIHIHIYIYIYNGVPLILVVTILFLKHLYINIQ